MKDSKRITEKSGTLAREFNERVITLNPLELDHHRIYVGRKEEESVSNYYKVLRTQLIQTMDKTSQRKILVTSALAGEGKSATALNLAIAFAQNINQLVILVEANLRRPFLQRVLSLGKDCAGLTDYLLDEISIETLLLNPEVGELRILPAGSSIPNAAELIGSNRMKMLLTELEQKYKDSYILIDAPPVLTHPDTLILSELADAVLMVVAEGATPSQKIREAEEKLKGQKQIFYVMNKCWVP
ncbi:MAG: CpsD/CapB family tyrosine-protein kinase [Desulfobacteraceae bacterium]|nr:CpsD/CapB family tyrosine-protein kinase [Desulfobacteraceae bacterium]MBC2753937.1 CpsD/CapB family tyrosine-protein kinase [Desulfobacteraceae bacterium]